jgi:hypothetical protein
VGQRKSTCIRIRLLMASNNAPFHVWLVEIIVSFWPENVWGMFMADVGASPVGVLG